MQKIASDCCNVFGSPGFMTDPIKRPNQLPDPLLLPLSPNRFVVSHQRVARINMSAFDVAVAVVAVVVVVMVLVLLIFWLLLLAVL